MVRVRLLGTLCATAVAVGAAVAITIPASAATTACSLTPTGGTVTRTVSGSFRSYNLRVPSGLTAPAPLLLSIHGLGSFPFGQEQASGWSPYADEHKFIVAYPAGNNNSWDVTQNSADVKFLREVADEIAATYCVDGKRTFADGGSLGGWMAQRLACDAQDRFASVSEFMSGPLSWFDGRCTLRRPITIALFHGESDPVVPLSAGQQTRDEWVTRDACNPAAIVETVPSGHAQHYDRCAAGSAVTWRSYAGLGHAYPTGSDGTDFRDRAWNLLMAHPMP